MQNNEKDNMPEKNQSVPPETERLDINANIYALFGALYHLSEDMRRELVYLLVLYEGPPPAPGQITHPQYGPIMAKYQSGHLKNVVKKLGKYYGKKLPDFVVQSVDKRNYLAHKFWYKNENIFYGEGKPDGIFQELKEYHAALERVFVWAREEVSKKEAELGVSMQFCIDTYNKGGV